MIDPSKVKAGDTVTLERDAGLAKVEGTVERVSHGAGTHVDIRHLSFTFIVPTNWILTAHQPAPEPEWKPGTVVQIEGGEPVETTATLVRVRDAWVNVDNGLSTEWLPAGPDVRPLVVIDPAMLRAEPLADVVHEVLARPEYQCSHAATAVAASVEAYLTKFGMEATR